MIRTLVLKCIAKIYTFPDCAVRWYEPFYCVGYIVAYFVAEGMAGPEVRGGEELPGYTAASVGDETLLRQLSARERGVHESLPGEGDMIHHIL